VHKDEFRAFGAGCAAVDVSVKESSVCIVDETGKVCREVKVLSHPEDLVQVLKDPAWRFDRIGLEAGPLSQWLFTGLAKRACRSSLPDLAMRR
jgi:transposase